MSVSMPETASAGRDGCAATQLRRSARQRENNKISPPSPPKREQKKERRMGGRGGGYREERETGALGCEKGEGETEQSEGANVEVCEMEGERATGSGGVVCVWGG